MPTANRKDGAASLVLTRREQQVVALVCEGHPNKAIASTLGISESSVKQRLNCVYRKFGGRKRKELIRTFSRPASQ